MQRQELSSNSVLLFLEHNAEYKKLKEVTARVAIEMGAKENEMCNSIEKCCSFKELYLTIGKVNSNLITLLAKAEGRTDEEFFQELKGYAATPKYKYVTTFILSLLAFGDAVKPHFDAEIAKEKDAVSHFIASSANIASLETLVNQIKNPSQASTAKMIQDIKKADTFDELLTLTSSIQNSSYSQRTYAWMNSGIFGGVSSVNYQLILLKNAVNVAHNEFKKQADTPLIASPASLSLQQ